MPKGSSSSKRGRAKPSPVIVVDYGRPLVTLEKPEHDANPHAEIKPGTVISDYKTKDKDTDRWIETDQGWIFVGVTGKGAIKDPAVLQFGKHSHHRNRLMARMPRLRGYRYGRSVDFPASVNAPSKMTNTGTKQIDCSSFTWCALSWMYDVGGIASYKRHQIIDTPDPWSAIRNAEIMNVASKTGEGAPSGIGIYLVQTWHSPYEFKHGHQLLVFIHGRTDHNTLQASSHPQRADQAPVWLDGSPAWTVYVGNSDRERGYRLPASIHARWAKLKDCDPFGGV